MACPSAVVHAEFLGTNGNPVDANVHNRTVLGLQPGQLGPGDRETKDGTEREFSEALPL